MAASALVVIACLLMAVALLIKYRSEKRKWMDAFHSELNRVAPDHRHQSHDRSDRPLHSQWTTVSKLVEHTIPSSAADDRSDNRMTDRAKEGNKSTEFQYLSFESNEKQKEVKKKCISKATQMESTLEMRKQIVIPIGRLIDESSDISDSRGGDQYFGSHFVTTSEIETKPNDNCIPRIISVQMSAQTESIVRAIRSELNKISHNSNAVPFVDDSQPEESIISNSSEA